jgi:hypothetical protein
MIPNAQQSAMSRFVYQLMDWIFAPTETATEEDAGTADLQSSES